MKIEKNSGEERLTRERERSGVPPGAIKGPPHCGKGEGKKTYLENEKMSRCARKLERKRKKWRVAEDGVVPYSTVCV